MGPGRGSTGSGPSHCPSPVPQGSSYVQTSGIMAHTYIRTIILNDMDIPLRRLLGLSGWGYAHFNAGVNFALTEFYEVGVGSVTNLTVRTMLGSATFVAKTWAKREGGEKSMSNQQAMQELTD